MLFLKVCINTQGVTTPYGDVDSATFKKDSKGIYIEYQTDFEEETR